MDEMASRESALVRHNHLVALRNGRTDNRKQPGKCWPEFAFHILDWWWLLRILAEDRTVDVIAKSHFEDCSQICRNTSDKGLLASTIGEGRHLLGSKVHPKAGCNHEAGRHGPCPT